MKPKEVAKKLRDAQLNRTGVGMSPVDAKAAVEGARAGASEDVGGGPATWLDGQVHELRRAYAERGDRLGSMPPPVSARGLKETAKAVIRGQLVPVLLDKVGERLAFERTGVRLYDQVLAAFDAHGSFPGGPTRADLERLRNEELAHFRLLARALSELGGDPTAITPSANLAAMTSSGVVQALGDPRRTLPEALEVILVAELVDHDGWETLIDLAAEHGKDDLAAQGRAALASESEHLVFVRGWLAHHYEGASALLGGHETREAAE